MKKDKDPIDAEQVQLERIHAFKLVFGSEDGKRVLRDMCREAQIFDSIPFTHTRPIDPGFLAFREGQKFVIMFIIEILGLDETKFIHEVMNEYD